MRKSVIHVHIIYKLCDLCAQYPIKELRTHLRLSLSVLFFLADGLLGTAQTADDSVAINMQCMCEQVGVVKIIQFEAKKRSGPNLTSLTTYYDLGIIIFGTFCLHRVKSQSE